MPMSLSPEISANQSEPLTLPISSTLDNEFRGNSTAVDASSVIPSKANNTLSHRAIFDPSVTGRELQLMEKVRRKIRLCDPRGVYFYRHIPCGWFASLLHFFTLIISVVLLSSLLVASYVATAQVAVIGVGSVTNITVIDVLELFFVGLIIVTALYSLKGKTRHYSVKRYGLAMLANAFNRVLFSYCKLAIYFGALVMVAILINEKDAPFVLGRLMNGVTADVLSVVSSLLNIIIFYRAFSSCHEELSLCD